MACHTFARRITLAALILLGSGCATTSASRIDASDELPHFVQVDEGYSRGGQPTEEGVRKLARMGVKTIINLRHRTNGMQWEQHLCEELGMRWVNIPMYYFWRPSDRQVKEFLALVNDPANRPVFVHCRKGRNRAGIMTAMYRMARHRWSPQDAYAEGLGLGMARWNPMTRYWLFRKAPRELLPQPGM